MRPTYRRYDDSVAGSPFDAIVIGSGIGGLGTAAILAKHGWRVLVLERHYMAGGLTHTFHRRGYEWDTGLHYLGRVHDPDEPIRRVFDYVTDGQLRWARMDPVYDRIVFDDASYDFTAGEAALRDMLCRAFPSERQGIAGYLNLLPRVWRTAERFFLQRVLPGWLSALARPVLDWPFRRYADRTTHDVLRTLTKDRRLIGVLTGQWGNYGLPPEQSSFAMHALVANNYLDGGSYPVGGPASIARHIVPLIERAGGQMRVAAEVREILVRNGRAVGVRMTNGDEIHARRVISNAGLQTTLGTLVPTKWRPPELAAKLARIRPSTAHVCLYLGLRGTAQELGLPRTNLWVHASYHHDESLRAYSHDPSARLPTVYINSPSAKDPEWDERYPGRSTLVAIAPTAFTDFERWKDTRWRKRGDDYDTEKARLSARLRSVVLEHLPQLRGRIEHEELSTPLTTMHFSGHSEGAMYGLEHTPERFKQPWLRSYLPIRDLFVAGQDVVTVGVGASLMSAVLTSSAILRRNVLGEVLR